MPRADQHDVAEAVGNQFQPAKDNARMMISPSSLSVCTSASSRSGPARLPRPLDTRPGHGAAAREHGDLPVNCPVMGDDQRLGVIDGRSSRSDPP